MSYYQTPEEHGQRIAKLVEEKLKDKPVDPVAYICPGLAQEIAIAIRMYHSSQTDSACNPPNSR